MKYFDDEDFTDETTEYQADYSDMPDDAALSVRAGRIKRYMVIALCAALLVAAGTVTWYVIHSQRDIDSQKTEVMTPYFLYLLNPSDHSSLALTIGNIHPGEVKREVICVSNQKPGLSSEREISRDSNFLYELEMAYTENLAVNYEVYELERDDVNGDIAVVEDTNGVIHTLASFKKKNTEQMTAADVSEVRRGEVYGSDLAGIVNLGRYRSFTEGTDGKKLELEATVSGNDVNYDMDYYLIEITWQDGINFEDYNKETDLCYVIVKALQPKPEEKTP